MNSQNTLVDLNLCVFKKEKKRGGGKKKFGSFSFVSFCVSPFLQCSALAAGIT